MLRQTVVDRIADAASQSVDSTQVREGQETATGTVMVSISGDRGAAADEGFDPRMLRHRLAKPAARRSRATPVHLPPGLPAALPIIIAANRHAMEIAALARRFLELLLGPRLCRYGQRCLGDAARRVLLHARTGLGSSRSRVPGSPLPVANVVGFRWGDGQDGPTSLDQQAELP
jgi:sugar/nucleoside kinase (ribokinase family)